MPRSVKDALPARPPVFVHSCASVRETAQIMLGRGVTAAIIVESGRLIGVFTERDALRFFAADIRNPDTTNIGDAVTSEPITVAPETPLERAREIMLESGNRHLPVVDEGEVLGMVSLNGLTRATLSATH